jgi:hypothetical protein
MIALLRCAATPPPPVATQTRTFTGLACELLYWRCCVVLNAHVLCSHAHANGHPDCNCHANPDSYVPRVYVCVCLSRCMPLLDAPTALAACCGFDLCHKYILYLYLYLCLPACLRVCVCLCVCVSVCVSV